MRQIIYLSVFFAGALAPLASAAERAEPVGLEAAFGNTIISTYPNGAIARLWLQKDGAYTSLSRRQQPTSGRWVARGAEICLSQKRPFIAPIAYCTSVPLGGVGTEWSAKAPTGESIRLRLVAGKVER